MLSQSLAEMGTELGMRYSRSSSSMLMASILFKMYRHAGCPYRWQKRRRTREEEGKPGRTGVSRLAPRHEDRTRRTDVHAATLDDVDELVESRVAANVDVGVGHAVLAHDGLDLVVRDFGQRLRVGDGDAALLLLLVGDVGRLLVEPDAEPFELVLDDGLVGEGLEHVEDDTDQVARSCDCVRADERVSLSYRRRLE